MDESYRAILAGARSSPSSGPSTTCSTCTRRSSSPGRSARRDPGRERRAGLGLHAAVRAPRRPRRPRRAADDRRDGPDHQRRQLLRRRRRPRRRGLRDRGVVLRDHRLRPRQADAAVLAAIIAGAALGFLVHNFHPASVFMGDCGSNLLGYLLGGVTVEGAVKTNALIALIGPLVGPRRAVPRHRLRRRQAAEVPAARLSRRPQALPPPLGASASASAARSSTSTRGRC